MMPNKHPPNGHPNMAGMPPPMQGMMNGMYSQQSFGGFPPQQQNMMPPMSQPQPTTSFQPMNFPYSQQGPTPSYSQPGSTAMPSQNVYPPNSQNVIPRPPMAPQAQMNPAPSLMAPYSIQQNFPSVSASFSPPNANGIFSHLILFFRNFYRIHLSFDTGLGFKNVVKKGRAGYGGEISRVRIQLQIFQKIQLREILHLR